MFKNGSRRVPLPIYCCNEVESSARCNTLSGVEWLIEAYGCSSQSLQSLESLQSLFDTIIDELELKPLGIPLWHQFPVSLGITGIWLLQESHLALHSFPEHHSLCLNLFCCKPRPELNWSQHLARLVNAKEVQVHQHVRAYARAAFETQPVALC